MNRMPVSDHSSGPAIDPLKTFDALDWPPQSRRWRNEWREQPQAPNEPLAVTTPSSARHSPLHHEQLYRATRDQLRCIKGVRSGEQSFSLQLRVVDLVSQYPGGS